MIALIDYGAGNLTSVKKALGHLGAKFSTASSPNELTDMSALIVPGVGNFKATSVLTQDWRSEIARAAERGIPLLGICLGLQWLYEGSEEAPHLAGLAAIPGTCSLIDGDSSSEFGTFKVPHVGWNSLHITRDSWLLDGIRSGDQVYFTHSYAAPVTPECVTSTTYGIKFASVVERGHLTGVQFHPEKSGRVGLSILDNFLRRVK